MDRRDALKALAAVAGMTGLTVTQVANKDVSNVFGVLVRVKTKVSLEAAERIRQTWADAWRGTPLEGVRVVVLDRDIDVEFVRTPNA